MIIEKRKVKRYSLNCGEHSLFRDDIIDLNKNANEFSEWFNPKSCMWIMEFLYETEKA